LVAGQPKKQILIKVMLKGVVFSCLFFFYNW